MANRRKAFRLAGLVAGLFIAVTAQALPTAIPPGNETAAKAPLQLALKVRTSTSRPDPCKGAGYTGKAREACYAELRARQERVRFNACGDGGAGRGYTYGCESGTPSRSMKPAATPTRDPKKTETTPSTGRTPTR